MRVEAIGTADELEALAPAWWALWRRCPQGTPFQCPPWLLAWWSAFSPGTLFSAALFDGDRLVGLAPFYLEDGPHGRRLLPLGISASDFLDVLLDPDVPEAAAALVDHFRSRCAEWDRWELEELAPGAAALVLPCPPGWREESTPQSACPAVPLGVPLPSGKLRKVKQSHNRLARRGPVAVVTPPPGDAEAALDTLFALHGARWNSRSEAGLVTDAVQRFHRACLPAMLAGGVSRLRLMQVQGTTVAAALGFRHRGVASAYMTGFDPDYAFESPLVTLFAHLIEEARRDGAHTFSFLRGREPYKYEWGATDRWNTKRSFRR